MPRFAANLSWLFTERPFPERFAAAAACGFDAVEFLFPYEHAPEQVARWAREAGVAVVLCNLPPGDWAAGERGLAGVLGREAKFRSSVTTALHYAEALDVPNLHAMAGIVPGGTRAAAWACYLDNLRVAADLMAASGRTLLIEPINRRDMPGYLVATLEDALAAVDALAAPNVRVQADLYHLQIEGGDLTRRLAAAMPHIGHVQVAAVPDRGEPDAGEVDWPYLFSLLDRSGYQGWVGCEYRPRGRTEDGLGWLTRYRQSSD